ncbi:PPPDE putative peptidase domain-containing protein [Dipodascopsis uninucleata]
MEVEDGTDYRMTRDLSYLSNRQAYFFTQPVVVNAEAAIVTSSASNSSISGMFGSGTDEGSGGLSVPTSSSATSLLPSPVITPSNGNGNANSSIRKYSRPASLRSWSSTTQMTTVVTATGSTSNITSPAAAQFPQSSSTSTSTSTTSSLLSPSAPVPIPTPGKRISNSWNYRSLGNKDEEGGNREAGVLINVYDLLQESSFAPVIWTLGIGVYHSAVEIDGKEYAYGGHDEPGISGVYYSKPKTPLPGNIVCKTSIFHGNTSYSPAEVRAIVNELSLVYLGTNYNLLYKNCNHFTDSLLIRLTNKPAPAWLNRATIIGSVIPCIIPQAYIKPPECDYNIEHRSSSDEYARSISSLQSRSSQQNGRRSYADYVNADGSWNNRMNSSKELPADSNNSRLITALTMFSGRKRPNTRDFERISTFDDADLISTKYEDSDDEGQSGGVVYEKSVKVLSQNLNDGASDLSLPQSREKYQSSSVITIRGDEESEVNDGSCEESIENCCVNDTMEVSEKSLLSRLLGIYGKPSSELGNNDR